MQTHTRNHEPVTGHAAGIGAVSESRTDAGAGLRRTDLIRWPAIIVGVFTTIATLIVLAALGTAVGMSVLDPSQNVGQASTEATIWGIASAVIAFFVGGLVAARTAAVGGPPEGAFNGFMVGVTAIALTVLFIGFGVGNLLGAAAANLGQVANLQIGGEGLTQAFTSAEASAWATFIGLAAALALAALGGLLGHRDRALDRPARG